MRHVVPPSSFSPADHEEYASVMTPSPALPSFLSATALDEHRQRQQRAQHQQAVDHTLTDVWRGSRSHVRKHAALVQSLGSAEAAAEELVNPTRLSFREELNQRPLDKAVLEEIFVNLHGKRVERKLKRGVSWEHWIAKGEGSTAPVFTASRKAQQAFGLGGTVRLVATAKQPDEFPAVRAGGTASERQRRGEHKKDTQQKKQPPARSRGAVLSEFAFVGRTSSGKSSLINALCNAAVTPYGHLQGTTTDLRFFCVADAMMLVDCPGYGFYSPFAATAAEASQAIRTMHRYIAAAADTTGAAAAKSITKKTRSSTRKRRESERSEGEGEGGLAAAATSRLPRRPVKRVFVCVSSRGLQHADWAMCDELERSRIPFTVVFTKTDAAQIRFLARLADYTRCRLVHYHYCKELMLTSALRLAGIDKLQDLIGTMTLQGVAERAGGEEAEEDFDFSAIV